MNLDNYIEGDFDTKNPFNHEDLFDDFYSENIIDCYNFYKEYDDIEPLVHAINHNNKVIENSITELQYLVDVLNAGSNVFVKNKLFNIITELKLTQLKRY